MMTQEAHLSQSQSAELERIYIVRNREQVLTYLEKHPTLIPFLLTDVPANIARYFPGSPLVLQWTRNWDAENEDDHFFAIYIASDLDLDDAMDIEDRLYNEWYVHAPKDIFVPMHIAVRSSGELML